MTQRSTWVSWPGWWPGERGRSGTVGTVGRGEGRQVFLPREGELNAPLLPVSNRVQTARYNVVDFLPKQLLAQFSKVANLYFLLIGCLQQIPDISPTGQYTTILPLVVFVSLAMAREAYDDWHRHRQDRVENDKVVLVWRAERWTDIRWADLLVGEIVRIADGDYFPADIVVLHTSSDNGTCYVETASLDGESNLKEKSALTTTQAQLVSIEAISHAKGFVRAEAPNANLYVFDGYISLDGQTTALTSQQLLLRGSKLVQTKEVTGIVVFTGEETKVRMNASPAPTKSPSIEKITNRLVASVFAQLLCLTILFTILSTVWSKNNLAHMWYLGTNAQNPQNPMASFATFLILYNTLIPISLYVTLEFVKLVQAGLMGTDIAMYHAESDTPAQARTSSINEDLGQVSYVFSDKTGTLTDNIMIFRKLSIGGHSYRHRSAADRLPEESSSAMLPLDVSDDMGSSGGYRSFTGSSRPFTANSTSNRAAAAEGSTSDLMGLAQNDGLIKSTLLAMALCHTVVPSYSADTEDGRPQYQGSSPDEVALVDGVAQIGFIVMRKRAETMTLKILGQMAEYEILSVLEFTSERKRMSVIIRTPEGRILLFCKGADQVILERVLQNTDTSRQYLAKTQQHIDQFAKDGLRTLAYAVSELTQQQYAEWHRVYHAASIALVHRQEALDRASEQIEINMTLLGAVAIEDRLQAGVPQTIESLTKAGIKLWVLTGDKLETAINIGYSSALIRHDSNVFVIKNENGDHEAIKKQFKKAFSTIAADDLKKHSVIVLEGTTIHSIFESDDLVQEFLLTSVSVASVICCRVSPIQKADIVRSVRENLNQITLAIGDGANDVGMIQAAHVGIGITGREGLQAARSSDYTFAQFRFLQRLLLVHGHWSYVRVSKFLLGSFYKCTVLIMTQVFFQFYNGFTGTSIYDMWTLACYNVIFALLPVIFVGVFEKDVEDSTLIAVPQQYKVGRRSELYSYKTFWSEMLKGTFHALLCSLVVIGLFGNSEGAAYNEDDGLYLMGEIVYTCVIFIVTIKIGILGAHNHTWANNIAVYGSIGIWFLFMAVYSYMKFLSFTFYGMFVQLIGHNSKFFFTVVIIVVSALLLDFCVQYYGASEHPSSTQILNELEKFGDVHDATMEYSEDNDDD